MGGGSLRSSSGRGRHRRLLERSQTSLRSLSMRRKRRRGGGGNGGGAVEDGDDDGSARYWLF